MMQPRSTGHPDRNSSLIHFMKKHGILIAQQFWYRLKITDLQPNRLMDSKTHSMPTAYSESIFHFHHSIFCECIKIVVQRPLNQCRRNDFQTICFGNIDQVFDPPTRYKHIVVHDNCPFGLKRQRALVPCNTTAQVGLIKYPPTQCQSIQIVFCVVA